MYDGDLIEFNQEYYVVICDAPVTEVESKEPQQKAVTRNSGKKNNKQSKKSKVPVETNKGRSLTEHAEEQKPDTKSLNGGRGEIKFF